MFNWLKSLFAKSLENAVTELRATALAASNAEDGSMTKRSPCVAVATLCLLTFATSASAECAWVLWTAGGG